MEWSDGLEPRSRSRYLVLIPPDKNRIILFRGESVPGLAVVTHRQPVRDGKWSHTTYQIELGSGVAPLPLVEGWETGSILEGLEACGRRSRITSWPDVANAVGIPIPVAMGWLRQFRPREAAALDRAVEELGALDTASTTGSEVVALSFGGPTNRQRAAGFWDQPILVVDPSGAEVGRLRPAGIGRYEVESGSVVLLDCRHIGGPGGGYCSLRLGVPAGCRATHGS